jgi:hypothetical protein
MSLDSLLERAVVALEKIAAGQDLPVERVTIVTAEPEKPKRGRPPKVEAEPVVAEATPVVETAAPKVSSFLDEDEPTVVPATAKTPEEYRKAIRQALGELQTLTTPEFALDILVKTGGSETLAGLKEDKMEATLKAALVAVAKAKARTQ